MPRWNTFFEDGDHGWDGLKKLCAKRNIIPIRLPKQKAVMFQAADLIAWKSRIACTEALKHEVSESDTLPRAVARLQLLREDLKSLEKVLVVPGDTFVYGVRALKQTCADSHIPQRGAFKRYDGSE